MRKNTVHDFGPETGGSAGSNQGLAQDIRLHSGRGRLFFRLLLISLGLVVAALLVGLIGVFFLFQGGAVQSDALNNRIEKSIRTILGKRYDVQLGKTDIEILGKGLISIASANVEIRFNGEDTPIATIRKVLVGVEPWSLINGKPKINAVTLEGAELNLGRLSRGSAFLFPADMQEGLTVFGKSMRQVAHRLKLSNCENCL